MGVAEDQLEAARDITAQAVDDDQRQRAALDQMIVRLEQDFVERVVAGLRGQVGGDQVEGALADIAQSRAEQGAGVGQVVGGDVGAGRFNGAEVAVDQRDAGVGPAGGEGEADRTVAAAEIEHALLGGNGIQLSQEQRGAAVDGARGEEPVARLEAQRASAGVVFNLRLARQLAAQLFE